MDSQCDYLVLDIPKGPEDDDDDDDDVDCELCKEPIRQGFYKWKGGTICVSLDQAAAGAMVPYVDAGISEHASGEVLAKSSTVVWYVVDSTVVELRGDIHLRDVPPNGTWLSSPEECLCSILRLRSAYLVCIALPELNRMVIEQKNDDGLIGLTWDCLADTDNLSWAVDLFGAFACDAMLAPVLHVILRSNWVKERKDTLDTNNDLKLGWAQEFYDYKCLPKDARGSLIFTYLRDCEARSACGNEHTPCAPLNETVGIHIGNHPGSDGNFENWALATVAHSVRYHVYKP
ncbi:CD58 antigen [Sarotherodon galilaeus]